MGEQYIDPHWLFDEDVESVIDVDQARELVEEPNQEEWDEWQARWAEDASVVEKANTGEGDIETDVILWDGFSAQVEPPLTPSPQATGPFTRRLAQKNATRPLRSALITLRLDENTPITLDAVVTDDGQQKISRRAGSRRFGCSVVALLLVLLCLSTVATLVWSDILPSLTNPLTALTGGSQGSSLHHGSMPSATSTSSTSTGVPIIGSGPTPEATAGIGYYPTSTPVANSTSTMNPYAQAATITFAAASESLNSPSSLAACPSGCSIPAMMDTPSRSFLHSQHTTGGYSYLAIDILFTTGSIGYVSSVSPYGSVNGVTVTCQNAPFNVNLGSGQSAWFQCVPTLVPVPAYSFNCSTCFGFTYSNPSGAYQDTSNEYVTQQDCSNAESTAQSQATSWEKSYIPNVGPQLVAESIWTDALSCSPSINQHGTIVTGSAWGHARAEGFNPADAKVAALSQLDAALPSGYVWKSSGTMTSSATCSPTWTLPPSGSTNFSINCVDSDIAMQVWTTAGEQQLATSLAGLPLSQAIQVCNTTTNSVCRITLSGGNGSTLPLSANAITISVT